MQLVERDMALHAIERVLGADRARRGGALFLVGEAGLGKTSALDYAIRRAGGGFQIAIGRGDVVEARLPFGPLEQALGPLLTHDQSQAGLLTPTGEVTAASRFWRVLRSLREVAVRPLLIAFDDLQWADPDSLALLHLLCRRPPTLPIAAIGTARPWPDAAVRMAEELRATDLAGVLRLAPLSLTAAASVFRAHTTGTPVPGHEVERALDLAVAIRCCWCCLLKHSLGSGPRRQRCS
jgi:hypothetical protein